MNKNVYIFKCTGTIDLCQGIEIYNKVRLLLQITCNKYSFVFRKSTNKTWSRSGAVKNMERNIKNYLSLEDFKKSNLATMAIYDVPAGSQSWDDIKRGNGFYIDSDSNEKAFYVYIVLPCSLSNDEVLELWSQFTSLHNTKYMVYFKMDSEKHVEITMLGIPVLIGTKTKEQCYSLDELKIVYKLHDLRVYEISDLSDVFPMCIATKEFSVNELSYTSKINISHSTHLYSK